eukprot:GAHX01002425.1.p1 GENE.GAHX01002425.1~~GAHX01002425.1.p1  ORF type:complete len:914 (-),score=227.63 GAHX01002425.1:36-2777(-)
MQKFEYNGSITTFACDTLLSFNDTHRNIIFFAEKNNLYIADLKSNKKEYIPTRHHNNINSLFYIPKRNLLITSDVSGLLILISTSSLTENSTTNIGPGLTSLSASPCGDFFLSFYKGKVKVFSIHHNSVSLLFAYTNLTDTVTKSAFSEESFGNSLICLCQTKENIVIAIEVIFTNFSKCYCSLVKHNISQRSNKINNFYINKDEIFVLENNVRLSIYKIQNEENKTKILKQKELCLEEQVLNATFYKVENESVNFITLNKEGKLKIHSLVNNEELSTVYELEYLKEIQLHSTNLISFKCNKDGSFVLIKYISSNNTHLDVFEWSTNNKIFSLISPMNNKVSSFDIKKGCLASGDDNGMLYVYKYTNGEDGKIITSFIKSISTTHNKINNIKYITNSLLLCSNEVGDLMLVNTNYETIKTIYKSEDKIIALNIEKRTEDILIYFSELSTNKIIVYSYNSNDILLELDAHKLPVTNLITCKEGVISSGYDGKIIKWNFLRQHEETRAFTSKNIIKSKITNQTFKIKDKTNMGVIFSNSIKITSANFDALFLGCVTEESHFILLDTIEFNMVLDYNFKGDLTPSSSKDNLFNNTQMLMKKFIVLKAPFKEEGTFKAPLAFLSASNEICIYSLNLQINNRKLVFAEIVHISSYTVKLNLEDYTKLKYHKNENKTKKLKIANDYNNSGDKRVVNLFNEFDEDNMLQSANELIDIKAHKGNIFVSTNTEGVVTFNERSYLSKSTLSSNLHLNSDNKENNTNKESDYEKELIAKINLLNKASEISTATKLCIEVLETRNVVLFDLYLKRINVLNYNLFEVIDRLNFTQLIILLEHLKHYLKKECINIERVNLLLKIIVKQRKEFLKNKKLIMDENIVNYNKERKFVECLNEVYVLHESITRELKEQADKWVCMMKLYIE